MYGHLSAINDAIAVVVLIQLLCCCEVRPVIQFLCAEGSSTVEIHLRLMITALSEEFLFLRIHGSDITNCVQIGNRKRLPTSTKKKDCAVNERFWTAID